MATKLNIATIISAAVALISLIVLGITMLTSNVQGSTRRWDKINNSDSLQWLTLTEHKEAIGNVNIRVDAIVDEQATMNEQTSEDIKDIKETVETMIIILKDVNKKIGKPEYNFFLPTGQTIKVP